MISYWYSCGQCSDKNVFLYSMNCGGLMISYVTAVDCILHCSARMWFKPPALLYALGTSVSIFMQHDNLQKQGVIKFIFSSTNRL